MLSGVNQDFRNTSSEIFVGSIGESIADTLKFFNVAQPVSANGSSGPTLNQTLQTQGAVGAGMLANPKFKEIKKVEL